MNSLIWINLILCQKIRDKNFIPIRTMGTMKATLLPLNPCSQTSTQMKNFPISWNCRSVFGSLKQKMVKNELCSFKINKTGVNITGISCTGRCYLQSISPTFYQELFRQYSFVKKLYNQTVRRRKAVLKMLVILTPGDEKLLTTNVGSFQHSLLSPFISIIIFRTLSYV